MQRAKTQSIVLLLATAVSSAGLTAAWFRLHDSGANPTVAESEPFQINAEDYPALRGMNAPISVASPDATTIARAPETQPAPPTLKTAEVHRGPIVVGVFCAGTIAANLQVDIKSRTTGQVLQLGPDTAHPLDIGDSVKKGDLLVQLDDGDQALAEKTADSQVDMSQCRLDQAQQCLVVAQQQLAQAHETASYNLDSAQAQFADARAKERRRRELLSENLDTQEDYETAADNAVQSQSNLSNARVAVEQLKTQAVMLGVKRQDVKLAEAQLHSDQLALDGAQEQLAYCTIRAPMDGVVTALSVTPGTVVFGGASVMELSDVSRIFVSASVNEAQISLVQLAQDAEILATAYPNCRFSGKVVRIASQGVTSGSDVSFEVKIEVTDPDRWLLKPRMTTRVNIIECRKREVLLAPVAAISHLKGKDFVTVQSPAGAKQVAVQLGLSDGKSDEIVSGLRDRDTLILQ